MAGRKTTGSTTGRSQSPSENQPTRDEAIRVTGPPKEPEPTKTAAQSSGALSTRSIDVTSGTKDASMDENIPSSKVSSNGKSAFADFEPPLPSLPLVPLSAGLRRKESALTTQSWVALALTLDGRDKLTKLLQYLSRLAAFLMSSSHPHHSQRMAALKLSLTNSRKAFRLGRTLIEWHRLQQLGLRQSLTSVLLGRGSNHENDYANEPLSKDAARPCTLTRSITTWPCRFYNSILAKLGNCLRDGDAASRETTASTPFLMVLGSAAKLLGLAGFWAMDNLNFLALSGALDNYQLNQKERQSRRQRLQTTSAVLANRAYFLGSVAGLYVTFRSYYVYRQEQLLQLGESSNPDKDAVELIKAKQFALITALLKSVCDILVFSNNPGIDLWQTYRGRKMHEGFHCLCGLTSAATVLYNNFPDAKPE